jgi:hypothetical protein
MQALVAHDWLLVLALTFNPNTPFSPILLREQGHVLAKLTLKALFGARWNTCVGWLV